MKKLSDTQIKYPIKMISDNGDIIVEFTSVNEGTVVGGTFYEIGFHSNDWTPANELTEWSPVEEL